MFDLNRPLHAYDADKIDQEIIVRNSKKGEAFEALDALDELETLESKEYPKQIRQILSSYKDSIKLLSSQLKVHNFRDKIDGKYPKKRRNSKSTS